MHKTALVILAVCSAAFFAAPAMAVVQSTPTPAVSGAPPQAAAPSQPAAQTADSNLDAVECREELKTGTRTGHWRACLTVREWRDYDDYLSRMRNINKSAWQ